MPDVVIPLLAFGAAYAATRDNDVPPHTPVSVPSDHAAPNAETFDGIWDANWHWPMPDIVVSDQRIAVQVSQEWRPLTHAKPHLGVDIMYKQTDGTGWWCPIGVPIQAARTGTLWSVNLAPRGWTIVIDHGPPWATFYTHLETVDEDILNGGKGYQIYAGQMLGTCGYDPLDARKVRHLHFATWYNGSGDKASIDPRAAMQHWPRSTWDT